MFCLEIGCPSFCNVVSIFAKYWRTSLALTLASNSILQHCNQPRFYIFQNVRFLRKFFVWLVVTTCTVAAPPLQHWLHVLCFVYERSKLDHISIRWHSLQTIVNRCNSLNAIFSSRCFSRLNLCSTNVAHYWLASHVHKHIDLYRKKNKSEQVEHE